MKVPFMERSGANYSRRKNTEYKCPEVGRNLGMFDKKKEGQCGWRITNRAREGKMEMSSES